MDCDIASYHVDSFNYLAEEGVHLAALAVPKEKFRLPSGEAVELSYTGASIAMPTQEAGVSLFQTSSLFCKPFGWKCRGIPDIAKDV